MGLAEHLKWVRRKYVSLERNVPSIEGWNSWNHFGCSINEEVVRQTADAIVATGLAAAGYEYGRSFLSLVVSKLLLLIFTKQ